MHPSSDLGGLLTVAGGLATISAGAAVTAWVTHPKKKRFRFLTTQPVRYGKTLVAFIIPAVLALAIFTQFSVAQVLMALGEFRAIDPTYGWTLTILVGLQAFMPLVAVATFVRVHYTPPHFVRYPGRWPINVD